MMVLSTGFYSGTYVIHHTTKCEIAVTSTTDLQPFLKGQLYILQFKTLTMQTNYSSTSVNVHSSHSC